jgi:hypothetical protein
MPTNTPVALPARRSGPRRRFRGPPTRPPAESLLGVEAGGLARRHPEEIGVKAVDAVEKTAQAECVLPGARGSDRTTPPAASARAARGRSRRGLRPAGAKTIRGRRRRREAAPDADDGDRIAAAAAPGFEPLAPLAQPPDLDQRALDGGKIFGAVRCHRRQPFLWICSSSPASNASAASSLMPATAAANESAVGRRAPRCNRSEPRRSGNRR